MRAFVAIVWLAVFVGITVWGLPAWAVPIAVVLWLAMIYLWLRRPGQSFMLSWVTHVEDFRRPLGRGEAFRISLVVLIPLAVLIVLAIISRLGWA
jgi:hypothetical protein